MKIVNRKLLSLGLLIPFVSYPEEAEKPAVTPEVTQVTQSETKQEIKPEEIQQNVFENSDQSEPELAQEQEIAEEDTDIEDDAEDTQDSDEVASALEARGNWHKKQQTVKKAHDLYQEIRQKEATVAQFENNFITEKNKLTGELEKFSQALGTSLSNLYQMLLDEASKIETVQKPDGQASQDERVKIAHIQETKNLITQVQKDIQDLDELYKSADLAISVLMQQIIASHNFEQKAFENYEKIPQVLSDQVAEQLYAEMVAARDNIVSISEYIKNDFTHYFNELSQNVTKHITLINQQLSTLKERGVDIITIQQFPQSEKIAPTTTDKSTQNWFSALLAPINSFFSAIIAWFKALFA